MKILILGHTGLVGSNLLERIRDKHEVVGISRRDGFDLLDKEKTKWFIEMWRPEIVYHLAAQSAQTRGEISPIDTTERNLNIFLNVLIPCINAKVKRFIYTSSVAVYGEADVPYSEDDIMKPKDIYGVNKWAAEQILKILSKVHGIEYTIFRPHNIYGPHQDMASPYKNVTALFMRNIMEDRECVIYGGGKMRRAFSYVDDVIDVLVEAMGEKFKNQTLNVGSSIDVDLITLLSMIEKVAGKKAKIKHLPARPQEIYLFLCNHRKLSNFFEYHETPLEEGLKKTWDFINLPKIKEENDEIHTNS